MTTGYFQIFPRDLLFLRDARPMSAADRGYGANWPRPDQLWMSLLHGLHRRWPQRQDWEQAAQKQAPAGHSGRFGSLKTAGPFPARNGMLYFPCPLDLTVDTDDNIHSMQLVPATGTNLPSPLSHAFRAGTLGKNSPPEWISAADYACYLRGKPFKKTEPGLYDAESNLGIAIDPATHATIKTRLYQAEYLRLRTGVGLSLAASCKMTAADGQSSDALTRLMDDSQFILLGGQQGMASLQAGPSFSLPETAGTGRFVKWLLLTPAVFPAMAANPARDIAAHPGGWLPNWIKADDGQVMLARPDRDLQRQPGERRNDWRRRVAQAPRCEGRLLAARIGKPLAFSGWDLVQGMPKPTLLAVPAGSVYLFECPDTDAAAALAAALAWNGGQGTEPVNRRSTLFGAHGFGLGAVTLLPEANNQCNQSK